MESLTRTFRGLEETLKSLVGQLARDGSSGGAKAGARVTAQAALSVTGVRQGSLVFDVELGSPELCPPLLDLRAKAVKVFLEWDDDRDREVFPRAAQEIDRIRRSLPDGLRVLCRDPGGRQRRLELTRTPHRGEPRRAPEEAFLQGWLKEVNREQRTAQLHRLTGRYVLLRFDRGLEETMLLLATRYVQVEGAGRLRDDGHWTSVRIREIRNLDRSPPFDPARAGDEPGPSPFDPDRLVTLDLTDEEWEEFDEALRHARKS